MKRLCIAFGLIVALAPGLAHAQAFPSKPLTLVVPYTAGGPTDTIARLVAQSMTGTLGQQVVVENVAGAGGTLGAARVARADPDGHTLLIHHVALAASPALYKKLPYDTAQAFEPVGLMNYGPSVLVARNSFEPATAADAIARIKQGGERITMAHAGEGSASHLCGLLLTQALGAKVTYVPYKGTGPALLDLVGGQVDVLCDQTTNALPQIQGGKVKAYAVTSAARNAQLPDLPSFQEIGLKDVEVTVWHALYAPKGTPAPAIATLHKALQVALDEKALQQRFTELGTVLFPADQRSPENLGAKLGGEIARWSEVIKAAGVEPQ